MKLFLRILIPIVIIAAGFGLMRVLLAAKPEAEKVARPTPGAMVEVVAAEVSRQPVSVRASGTVIAAQQISLVSEVGGRVVSVSRELIPGGTVKKGEMLLRIDPRDYQLALEQQAAQVDRVHTELRLEQSRKKVAEREWELLGESDAPADGSLALRDPQLKTAEAALKAAQSGVKQAELAVSKTVLRAPFNALVQQKQVDVGQLVGPQVSLATLVGTDAFWVQVSIPVDRLSWIDVPGVGASPGEGAEVVVQQRLGRELIERRGRVKRLLGELDPVGRMARLLVEIRDPLGLAAAEERGLPLLLGAYVDVVIEGHDTAEVVRLPRLALREGNKVYVLGAKQTLEVRSVEVVWREADDVLVRNGIGQGDKVIVSPLPVAVEGMKLRTADTVAAESPPAAAASKTSGAAHE